MDIQNLKTFITVADLGNYEKAAQELGYAQSTVSAQIHRLETELGVSLFERIGRKNYLTKAGELFLSYANDIMSLVHKSDMLSGSLWELGGVFRIGVVETLLFSKLLPVIREFCSYFPKLEIDIVVGQASDLLMRMRQNQLDVVYISHAINTDSFFKSLYCRREEVAFITSSSHPLAAKEKVFAEQIFSYPFLFTEKSGFCQQKLMEYATEHHYTVKHAITIDNATAIVSLLGDGESIAFLPCYILSSDFYRDGVCQLKTGIPPFSYYNQILVPKGKSTSPFIDMFVGHIEKYFPQKA